MHIIPRTSREWRLARWLWNAARQWGIIVAVSLASLAAFAAVGEDVLERETSVFDNGVRSWMLAHRYQPLYRATVAITWLGNAVVLLGAALVVAAWLWHRSGRRTAAVIVTAPAVSTGLFAAVKALFERPRPAGAAQMHISTYSFPSGHATVSAAVLVTLAYVLAREKILPRPAAIALALIGPLVVGVSRLYLDVHWATDVLGGWAAGLLVAALSAALYERLRAGRSVTGEPTPEVHEPA